LLPNYLISLADARQHITAPMSIFRYYYSGALARPITGTRAIARLRAVTRLQFHYLATALSSNSLQSGCKRKNEKPRPASAAWTERGR
jgi:hypothetical protein